ncbi:MAG: PIN domain-containing protein, partial [Streptosporangiaceae bacterium]
MASSSVRRETRPTSTRGSTEALSTEALGTETLGTETLGTENLGTGTPRTYVLDTSVLLADPGAIGRFAEHRVVLPVVVITELEAKRHHPEL